MKIEDYIIENGCDFGGINLGRIKFDAWEKIKNLELNEEELKKSLGADNVTR